MFYSTWTPSYVAPTQSGIEDGTLSVPMIKDTDWNLVSEDPNDVVYRTTSFSNSIAASTEVHLQQNVKNNPYGALKKAPGRPLPLSLQVPGLQMASVYCGLDNWGIASNSIPPDANNNAICPVKTSLTFQIPVGVSVTVEQLQDQLKLLLSHYSSVDGQGNVVVLGKLPSMAGGGIRIK